jgi:hypothetical protein
VQLRGSAQRLAAAFMRGAFAGVVHEGNRGVQLPLERAQEAEQWSDLASDVLVDGVQGHGGIKDEEFGPQVRNAYLPRTGELHAFTESCGRREKLSREQKGNKIRQT